MTGHLSATFEQWRNGEEGFIKELERDRDILSRSPLLNINSLAVNLATQVRSVCVRYERLWPIIETQTAQKQINNVE